MPEVPMLPPQPHILNLSTPPSPDLTSRESKCSSEDGCEQKMLAESAQQTSITVVTHEQSHAAVEWVKRDNA